MENVIKEEDHKIINSNTSESKRDVVVTIFSAKQNDINTKEEDGNKVIENLPMTQVIDASFAEPSQETVP